MCSPCFLGSNFSMRGCYQYNVDMTSRSPMRFGTRIQKGSNVATRTWTILGCAVVSKSLYGHYTSNSQQHQHHQNHDDTWNMIIIRPVTVSLESFFLHQKSPKGIGVLKSWDFLATTRASRALRRPGQAGQAGRTLASGLRKGKPFLLGVSRKIFRAPEWLWRRWTI